MAGLVRAVLAAALLVLISVHPVAADNGSRCGASGVVRPPRQITTYEVVLDSLTSGAVHEYYTAVGGVPVIGANIGVLTFVSVPGMKMTVCNPLYDPITGEVEWNDRCMLPHREAVAVCLAGYRATVLVWCTCPAGEVHDYALTFPMIGIPI